MTKRKVYIVIAMGFLDGMDMEQIQQAREGLIGICPIFDTNAAALAFATTHPCHDGSIPTILDCTEIKR